jgi:hypothetical protein
MLLCQFILAPVIIAAPLIEEHQTLESIKLRLVSSWKLLKK